MLHGSNNSSNVKVDKKSFKFHPLTKSEIAPVAYESFTQEQRQSSGKRTETRTLTIPRNAPAIKDASNYKAGNVSQYDSKELIRQARAMVEANRQKQAQSSTQNQQVSNSQPLQQNVGNLPPTNNATFSRRGTTSRWDNAVMQFRGSRKPNSLGNGF